MVIITIMFIFGSIIAAFEGDFSGLAMKGKFVLFIVMFIVIGTILSNPALLVAVIVIGCLGTMCK